MDKFFWYILKSNHQPKSLFKYKKYKNTRTYTTFVPENSILLHVTVFCIYLFSMVATLNFNCDNILVASYIKFVIIEFDNFDIVLKRMYFISIKWFFRDCFLIHHRRKWLPFQGLIQGLVYGLSVILSVIFIRSKWIDAFKYVHLRELPSTF